MTRPPKQPGYYYVCPECKNPTSTQCRKGKPVRCTNCIDKAMEQRTTKRRVRQMAREEKIRIELARITERMAVRTEESEAIRLARIARRKLTHKKWLARQPDKPKKTKTKPVTNEQPNGGGSVIENESQFCLTLTTDNDEVELHDRDRRGPDHIMDALREVSRESGVPIEDFYYAYDASIGPMAELNRRAYAIAASRAGISVMPEFVLPDIPCDVYRKPRRKISPIAMATLRAVHDSLRLLGDATCKEVANHSGISAPIVKGRMARLNRADLVREGEERDGERGNVWTVTGVSFDDVFDVQDSPVPSIGPAVEQQAAA